MPCSPITIRGIDFKSKAALTRHTRCIVEGYQDGEMVSEDHFWFIAELVIRRHDSPHEKFVPGRWDEVTGIRVRHQSGMPHMGNSPSNRNHCYVVYADGSEIDFSWRKCCEGSFSAAKDADHALRRAADPLVRAYKRRRFSPVGGNPSCDATGVPLTHAGSQVDHYPLTWVAIRNRFLGEQGLLLEDVETQPVPEGGCVLKDKELLERFQKYHEAVATLRLVTTEVNRGSWRDKDAIRT